MLPLSFEVVAAPDLFSGHALSFTEVGFDDVGIRIEYAIEPAVTMRVPGLGWVGFARDDLGNDYEDAGGAYGPAVSADRTEGVVTMPFPVEDATRMRVRLWPGTDTAGFDDERSPSYELLVSLEL